MPLYQVYLRFAHDATWPQRRKWTNIFHLNAASSAAAAAAGVANWIDNLRPGVRSTVFCYEVYATDLVSATDDFTVQEIPDGSRRGTMAVAITGEEYLPKACLGVRLNVPGSRPSIKYFRPGLYEGDITDGVTVSSAVVDAVTDAFTAFLAAGGGTLWRDPDDEVLTAVGRITLTTREFGRYAGNDVPQPPAVG